MRDIGVRPLIRCIKISGAINRFAEVGARVRLLSTHRISSDFTLGAAFQFADVASVHMQFNDRQPCLAGYRFQHISNGGIKEPNPGINFSQLYLQYHF